MDIRPPPPILLRGCIPMLDVVFLSFALVFFFATAAYADGCDRL